jgi:UDP-N-acetyl-2-amino-2-deoxyglucuronate dehydrogenase
MPQHIGLAGAGNISETHARAARSIPGVDVVACYGLNREKTARLAREHDATPYDSFERFLDHRPMDLVAIGSPSGLHAEHGIAAAERGLHVLVEKPLDITTGRVDALVAAAASRHVKLGVFFQDRLSPDLLRLKTIVESGELGRPIMISGRVKWHRPPEYYARSRWRGTWALDGGGAVMNQGIHTVDLLLWLFGPVRRVHGFTATRLHAIEVEDTAAAVLEFTSGAVGTLEATTCAFPGYARQLEVTGSEGTVFVEHDRLVRIDLRSSPVDTVRATPSPVAASRKPNDGQSGGESASSPTVSDASGHRRILEDFIRAIETDGTPACDGREGRRSVELVEAIYESVRTASPVRLNTP